MSSAEQGSEQQWLAERTQAFYAQSGGPHNPDIDRILNNHLRNAPDHGEPGHMEDLEDVFRQVIQGDQSLRTLYKVYMRRKADIESKRDSEREADREAMRGGRGTDGDDRMARLEGQVAELTELVRSLRAERKSEQ